MTVRRLVAWLAVFIAQTVGATSAFGFALSDVRADWRLLHIAFGMLFTVLAAGSFLWALEAADDASAA